MQRRGPPPPPGSKERRAHTRFQLYAQIELHHGGEVSVLPVSNISAGGVAVTLGPGEMPGVNLHDTVTVFLHHEEHHVTAAAEVVRVSLGGGGKPPSFALMWTDENPKIAQQLAELLGSLTPIDD